MPGSRFFTVRLLTPAPPHTVYRLLADATSWKHWAGPLVTRSEWESEPDPTGAGGIRRLGRPSHMVREEITAAEPPHHHGYRLLSGQPVRSYQADVFISDLGDLNAPGTAGGPGTGASRGSEIEWTGSVVASVPGTGTVMHFLLGRMVEGFARRLAAAAEAESATPHGPAGGPVG